jgi:hypothetical protein
VLMIVRYTANRSPTVIRPEGAAALSVVVTVWIVAHIAQPCDHEQDRPGHER